MLTQCRECTTQFAGDLDTCPHCGTRPHQDTEPSTGGGVAAASGTGTANNATVTTTPPDEDHGG